MALVRTGVTQINTVHGSFLRRKQQALIPLPIPPPCCRRRRQRLTCNSDNRATTPQPDPNRSKGFAVVFNSATIQMRILSVLQEGKTIQRRNSVPPALQELIDELEGVPAEQRNKITREGVIGLFTGSKAGGISTTSTISEDGTISLGTFTFKQFKPHDLQLKIECNAGQVGTLLQGVDSPDQYQVDTTFKVLDGPLVGLVGVQSALGRFDMDTENPIRQNVYFTGIKIAPSKDMGQDDVQKWVQELKPHNPMMGDDGAAVIEFPQHIRAFRDFIYFDDDMQITRGNRGSLVIVTK